MADVKSSLSLGAEPQSGLHVRLAKPQVQLLLLMTCFRRSAATGRRFKDNVWTGMSSNHIRTPLTRHQLLSSPRHKLTTPQHTRSLKGSKHMLKHWEGNRIRPPPLVPSYKLPR